jgi:tight adherence protein B
VDRSTIVMVLVTSLVFTGAMTTINLLYWGWRSREAAKAAALARRLGTTDGGATSALFREQLVDPWADTLGSLGKRLNSLLRESGTDWTMGQLLGRSVALAIIGAFSTSVLLKGPVGLIGILFGVIPTIILSSRAEERARKLSEQLPDGLDLVSRSLQAGHGLSDAMKMCATEMPIPIAQEFGRVHEEHNLGRGFRECLTDLCERNPRNFDLRIFVSSVALQRDTGGNLIEILQNIAKTIRDRFIFHRKVKALTSEARVSAYILGGLPFVVTFLIVVMRPEYLTPLVEDPLGRLFMGLAAGNFGIGILVMRSLSKVDV